MCGLFFLLKMVVPLCLCVIFSSVHSPCKNVYRKRIRLLKTIRELMASHQRYIWARMLAKIGQASSSRFDGETNDREKKWRERDASRFTSLKRISFVVFVVMAVIYYQIRDPFFPCFYIYLCLLVNDVRCVSRALTNDERVK